MAGTSYDAGFWPFCAALKSVSTLQTSSILKVPGKAVCALTNFAHSWFAECGSSGRCRCSGATWRQR